MQRFTNWRRFLKWTAEYVIFSLRPAPRLDPLVPDRVRAAWASPPRPPMRRQESASKVPRMIWVVVLVMAFLEGTELTW